MIVGDVESIASAEPLQKKSTLIGKIGNFSVQYNLGAASAAVILLTSQDDTALGSGSLSQGDYPEPKWAKYVLLGTVFAGSVFGMLIMGYLGDLIGRRRAMIFTLLLVVSGALGCALLPWGGVTEIYATLVVCRFIVGAGVGGIYPLSAAHSAEQTSHNEDDDVCSSVLRDQAASRVGWSFFWQVPGSMTPYVVCLILIGLHQLSDSFDVDAQFRILFGLGAVPASLVIYLTMLEEDSEEFLLKQQERKESEVAFNPWTWARAQPEWPQMLRALIGTTGTWFLYDISFYGTAIFTPTILKDIFGDKDSIADVSWQSCMTTAFGIPGVICGIYGLTKKGCYWLDFYGFLLMATCFGVLSVVYGVASDQHALLFALFLVLNFAINNGPSVATFVLPALIFPPEVRTTFHGISAAGAKLGAMAGTFMYAPLSDATSFSFVMGLQCGFSLLGALLTYFFIPRVDNVIGKRGSVGAGELDGLLVQVGHKIPVQPKLDPLQ